jgi:hypothetical protein
MKSDMYRTDSTDGTFIDGTGRRWRLCPTQRGSGFGAEPAPRDESGHRWWAHGRQAPARSASTQLLIDEEEAEPTFEPEHKHDVDLAWFARLGPDPRGLTPKMQERWRRINRCLDGLGRRLMAYYRNEIGFDDRRLAAILPQDRFSYWWVFTDGKFDIDELKSLDRYRAKYITSESDEDGAKLDAALAFADRALTAEYFAYVEQAQRPYGECVPPLVMTEMELLRAIGIKHGRTEIREVYRRGSRGSVLPQDRVLTIQKEQDESPDDRLSQLIRDGRVEPSTWGQLRVSISAAIEILGLEEPGHVVRPMRPADMFAALRKRSKEPLPDWYLRARAAQTKREGSSPDDSEDREVIRDLMRGQGETPWSDLYWDQSKLESDVGKKTTSVRELAKKFWLNSAQVRKLLVEHGCEQAKIPNTKIPVDWLRTPDGERFRAAAGRLSRKPRRRKTSKLSHFLDSDDG